MTYHMVYCKQTNSVIAIGDSSEIVNEYISQFNNDKNVEIFKKNLPNGLEEQLQELLQLTYVTPNLILTNMELCYYKESLYKLYDDMKTTVSGLIVYSNIGSIAIHHKENLKQTAKFLYDRIGSFDDFINGLDRSVLFGTIIQNPITMQNILYEHIAMVERYKHLKSPYYQ